MKRLKRDILIFALGVSIAFLGKEAIASKELAPMTISCSAGDIKGVYVNEAFGSTIDLNWFSSAPHPSQNGSVFTGCVLSTEQK